MDDPAAALLYDYGTGAKEGAPDQVLLVNGALDHGVVDSPDLWKRLRGHGIAGESQVELCQLEEWRVRRLGRAHVVAAGRAPGLERSLDLLAGTVDALHLVAADHLVKDEAAEKRPARGPGQATPELGNVPLAANDLLAGKGQLPGHRAEQLPMLKGYARAKGGGVSKSPRRLGVVVLKALAGRVCIERFLERLIGQGASNLFF